MKKHFLVLDIISKIFIPFILLFALYVQFHGDFGPGGGFQAGVIFAVAFTLYVLVFGFETAVKVVSHKILRIFAALGLLLYGGVGVAGLLFGGNYLEYTVLLADPVSGQHLGIFLIELGVGITVASIMILIFFSFVGYKHRQHDS